jgi:urease subunit alpha
MEAGIVATLATRRRVVAVRATRDIRRADLVANTEVPPIGVSPVDGTVTLGGRVLGADPVSEVPLNRRYLLT